MIQSIEKRHNNARRENLGFVMGLRKKKKVIDFF